MWRPCLVCHYIVIGPFSLTVKQYVSVNVFYRVNQEGPDPNISHDLEKTRQEKEFKIGSIGFADSSGILLASLLAVPTEMALCKTQIRRGKLLCQGL